MPVNLQQTGNGSRDSKGVVASPISTPEPIVIPYRHRGPSFDATRPWAVQTCAQLRSELAAKSDTVLLADGRVFVWSSTAYSGASPDTNNEGARIVVPTGDTTGGGWMLASRASGLPPNIYGNAAIAKRLIDSLTPEKKVSLIHMGDSRCVFQQNADFTQTHGWGIPWGGITLNMSPVTASAKWSSSVVNASTAPVASPIGTYLGRISADSLSVITYTAAGTTGWANNRTLEYSLLTDTYVTSKAQFTGRPLTWKLITHVGPYGVTGAPLQQYARATTGSPPFANNRMFGTYNAASGVVVNTLTVPNWNFVAQPGVSLGVLHDPVFSAVAGEVLYTSQGSILESDIGVTHYNLSVGGRTIASYLNQDIFSDALWTQMATTLSGEKVLWLSLGTNASAPGAGVAAAMLAELRTLIGKFRAVFPGGSVVLDTAYYTLQNITGFSRIICEAAQMLANVDPNVLVIDTAAELGPYHVLNAGGYFGGSSDGVHFADTGRALYMATFSAMVARTALAA